VNEGNLSLLLFFYWRVGCFFGSVDSLHVDRGYGCV